MLIVYKTAIVHIVCIILFTILYYHLSEHFYIGIDNNDIDNKTSLIDFIMLSTTIQSGIGVYNLYPITTYGKISVIIQQLILLFVHIITLYVFVV